jgi:hypothetical protein
MAGLLIHQKKPWMPLSGQEMTDDRADVSGSKCDGGHSEMSSADLPGFSPEREEQ